MAVGKGESRSAAIWQPSARVNENWNCNVTGAQGVAPNFLHLLGGLERYALKNNTGFRNDAERHGAKSNELATASPSSGG
jgi:hypothetical protein